MQKRERILLGVMGLTALVAAYMLLSGPAKSGPDAPRQATKAEMDQMSKTVEQERLTPQQAYRIGLLADGASGNPFYQGAGIMSIEDDRRLGSGSGTGADLVYSGYIKLGNKIFAVINGVEYAHGDELAEGDYKVQAIDKAFVMLERTDGSTGHKLVRRVPLVEDDTDKIRIRVVKKR